MSHGLDDDGWAMGPDDEKAFRLRRLDGSRRLEASPEYAEFLADELDSREYARSLVRATRRDVCELKRRSPSPLKQAALDRDVKERLLRAHSSPTVRLVRTSSEYQCFLREEISSQEYAASIAKYARLEGMYRRPSAAIRFRNPGTATKLIDWIRVLLSLGGMAFLVGAALPILVASNADLVPATIRNAWALSFVGGLFLALTVVAASSATLLAWMHSLHLWLDGWRKAPAVSRSRDL